MLAILGGLGAAIAWTVTTLNASRATRHVDSWSLLASIMTVGLIVTVPAAAISGVPTIHGANLAWLIASGCANVAGLLLTYSALSVGKVGVVGPITSTEGAVAAVIAVLAGASLSGGTAACIVVIVLGVALAARTPGGGAVHARAIVLASLAALAFGLGLYSAGRNGQALGVAWAVLPPRVVGVAVIALPLLVTGRWRIPRASIRYGVVGGLFEVIGFAAYAFGARHNLPIAAVLASQFAGFSAVVGWVAFHERLTRVQVAGVVGIVVGVSILSAIHG